MNVSAALLYTIYVYTIDPHAINLFDYFNFYLSILGRSIVIAAKYGTFGKHTFTIVRSTRLPNEQLDRMQIRASFDCTDIDMIEDRINEAL